MNLQKISTFFRSYLLVRILLNAVFLYVWIRGTANHFNLSGVSGDAWKILLLHTVLYNIALLATLYINTLLFIPKFLLRKRYLLYASGLLLSILLHTAILVFYREYITDHIPGIKAYDFSYYSAFTRNNRTHTSRYFLSLFYSSSCFTVIQFSLVFLGQHFL